MSDTVSTAKGVIKYQRNKSMYWKILLKSCRGLIFPEFPIIFPEGLRRITNLSKLPHKRYAPA